MFSKEEAGQPSEIPMASQGSDEPLRDPETPRPLVFFFFFLMFIYLERERVRTHTCMRMREHKSGRGREWEKECQGGFTSQ